MLPLAYGSLTFFNSNSVASNSKTIGLGARETSEPANIPRRNTWRMRKKSTCAIPVRWVGSTATEKMATASNVLKLPTQFC
jgi:hypothetical protein